MYDCLDSFCFSWNVFSDLLHCGRWIYCLLWQWQLHTFLSLWGSQCYNGHLSYSNIFFNIHTNKCRHKVVFSSLYLFMLNTVVRKKIKKKKVNSETKNRKTKLEIAFKKYVGVWKRIKEVKNNMSNICVCAWAWVGFS